VLAIAKCVLETFIPSLFDCSFFSRFRGEQLNGCLDKKCSPMLLLYALPNQEGAKSSLVARLGDYCTAPPGMTGGPGGTKMARACPVFLKIPNDPPSPTPTAELPEKEVDPLPPPSDPVC